MDAAESVNRSADLLAVNHWDKAIATHQLNHPEVRHLCANLDNVEPRKVVSGGRLDVLLASPECTHHSNARGGKPMSDQSRASAWHVLSWAEQLRVENIVVENVKEFTSWGPLDAKGRPMKSKKGALFVKFCETLAAMGYRVDWRVLNSAHYGAATARERLFIQASRGRRPRWPEQSHSARPNLLNEKPFRAARDIIDWSLEGKSIFGRKKPLSEKTIKRILAGLKKFGGLDFVLGQQSCSAPRDLSGPIPTIATAGAISLIQPCLIKFKNNSDACSIDKPLDTLTCKDVFGLLTPFLVRFQGGERWERSYSTDEPLKTLDTSNRYALCEPLIQPWLTVLRNNCDAASLDEPAPTICAGGNHIGLCQPEPIAIFECDGELYALLDIRFRMLQPHELAAAMGLDGYKFSGTKSDSIRMIGNAVERNTAAALCKAVLQ